jgi:hypothetical protein
MQMDENDDVLPEYDLDFSKSKPNPYAARFNEGRVTVTLDSDVAKDFPSSNSVNEALRFLIRITEKHQAELTSK